MPWTVRGISLLLSFWVFTMALCTMISPASRRQERDSSEATQPGRAGLGFAHGSISHQGSFLESTWPQCQVSPCSSETVSTARTSSEISQNGQLALEKPLPLYLGDCFYILFYYNYIRSVVAFVFLNACEIE